MPVPRILIVDDHVEVRRVLRSGLESLGHQLDIVDVPSGEEALVVAASKPVDLLISDLRMAGMTGLELKLKIQTYCPGLKVFVITGITDPEVRQASIAVGIDAFFLKPIDMDAFLQAVEATLGLVEPPDIAPDQQSGYPSSDFNPLDRLFALRTELDAVSVVLIDDQARVLIKDGDLPGALLEPTLHALLLDALKSSQSISSSLDRSSPESLMIFPGGSFNLALAHVGQVYALLVVSEKVLGTGFLQMVTPAIRRAANDLALNLSSIDFSTESQDEFPSLFEEADELIEPEDDAFEIEDLFDEASQGKLLPEEVDAFWKALNDEEWFDDQSEGSTITYEQARQLGLVPKIRLQGEEDQTDQQPPQSEE